MCSVVWLEDWKSTRTVRHTPPMGGKPVGTAALERLCEELKLTLTQLDVGDPARVPIQALLANLRRRLRRPA
jgi:hypothetical protein